MNYMDYKVIKTETIIEDGKEYEVRTWNNGDQRWFLNKREHREKGPAIILFNGVKTWCQYGCFHRLDGPVQVAPGKDYYSNVKRRQSKHSPPVWVINGKPFSLKRYDKVRTMLALDLA
jgi:hypothetical protein